MAVDGEQKEGQVYRNIQEARGFTVKQEMTGEAQNIP